MWLAYFSDTHGNLKILGFHSNEDTARRACHEHLTTLVVTSDHLVQSLPEPHGVSTFSKVVEHRTGVDGWFVSGQRESVTLGFLGVCETMDPEHRTLTQLPSARKVSVEPKPLQEALMGELTQRLRELKLKTS